MFDVSGDIDQISGLNVLLGDIVLFVYRLNAFTFDNIQNLVSTVMSMDVMTLTAVNGYEAELHALRVRVTRFTKPIYLTP
jgi:hypothetical protein